MNITNVWMALPPQKRIASVLSVIATVAGLYFLMAITLKPKVDLLYAGLDPAAAGEIITKLEGMDVAYEVRGGAIYADVGRRDALRLELARDGLPRQSVVGYELFDDLNSFAMTSDMFNTAYWRAKEGELARTLLAMPSIRAARVHLGTQKSRGFTNGPSATSASVTLSASGGISAQQAKAIQYLTALSVAGLKPSDVAVIDMTRGVVAGPGLESEASSGGMGQVERAAKIKQNLLALLEARVGIGNARVNVSLDIDRKHETIAERRFDPDGRVVKSQTSNETANSNTGTNGSVTVASNLPEGDAPGGSSSSEGNESSETVTYEISEIVKNTEILPGAIKRMTVAVLLSDVIAREDDGTVTSTPRPPEELQALQDLVSAAAGLDETRGDRLTIKSLPFDQPLETEMVEKPGVMTQFMERYLWSTIQALILAIVVLTLGLFVIRPLLTTRQNEEMSGLLPMSLDGGDSLTDTRDIKTLEQRQTGVPLLENSANVATDPVEMLKTLTSEKTEDAADLLASWLDQDAQVAN